MSTILVADDERNIRRSLQTTFSLEQVLFDFLFCRRHLAASLFSTLVPLLHQRTRNRPVGTEDTAVTLL